MNYDDEVNKLISQKVYNIKEKVVEINDNVPIFNKQDYETPEGKPIYFEFDELNRSTGAIALISLNTIPLVTKKKLDYPDPNGWDKNFEGKKVFERCHIIVYNLSAKLADKRNLFIGTKFLNSSSKANCNKIEKVDSKYIQETTISYNELIKSNLKPCTKCISFK